VTRSLEARAGAETLGRFLGDESAFAAGPTLIAVVGMHANEPAGLFAAGRVHASIGRTLELRAGRVVTLRGNLAALSPEVEDARGRPRYIDRDLNRMFAFDERAGEPVAESAERDAIAHELERIVRDRRGPCYLIDLHTVSSESPAFIALEDSLPARRFAMGFPLPKLLGIEEELSGLLIDYASNVHRVVSCVVEAGRHDDPGSIDVHEAVIIHALQLLGMVAGDARTEAGRVPVDVIRTAACSRHDHVYDIRERYQIREPGFEMHESAVAFTPVRALRTHVAVDGGHAVTPSVSGRLFMPNRQPDPRVGDDGFFVVRRVGRLWLDVSAWLRERAWVHRLLPFVLPGVRRRPGEPGDLLVAPDIASVFRRHVIHLFGYRIVRRGPEPRVTDAQRIGLAVRGTLGALARMLSGLFRGGEAAALPSERASDWVVRRRTLDRHSAMPPSRGNTPTAG
jgi:hypothetical protein